MKLKMKETRVMSKKYNLDNTKKEKGITLIALVITIIVLLILAGVSIATLTGENGILNQASRAADNTKNATEKEQVELAYNTQVSKNMEKGKYTVDTNEDDIEGLQDELDNLDTGATANGNGEKIEVVFPSGNKYRIQGGKVKGPIKQAKVGKKVEGENKEYTKNGTAEIPVGFAIVPGLDDVEKGLVISDDEKDTEETGKTKVANGNQFVWVPVEDFSKFVRYNFQSNTDAGFVTDKAADEKCYEPNPESTDTEYSSKETLEEVKKMYKSVKENGGFYIGRYEAGTTDTTKEGIRGEMVCKKGATVYNSIPWGESMTKEEGGAVQVARGFADQNNYTNVTSTLCYGVQWDAVMRWISKDNELKQYLTDSNGKGNYSGKLLEGGTGSNEEYQMKNIYDMAGNVNEWTMEAFYTSVRICRGGGYAFYASSSPVSTRISYAPDNTPEVVGFRPALYVR